MVVVEHDDVLKLDFLNSDFEFLLTFLGFKHHPLEPVPGFGQFSTKKHPRVSPRRFLGFDALCLHKHVTKSLGDSNPTWRSRKNWQRYGKKNTGIVHPPQKKTQGTYDGKLIASILFHCFPVWYCLHWGLIDLIALNLRIHVISTLLHQCASLLLVNLKLSPSRFISYAPKATSISYLLSSPAHLKMAFHVPG